MSFQFEKKLKNGSLRILAFSDWRTQDYKDLARFINVVPDIDLLVYAGDDIDRMLAAESIVENAVLKTKSKKLLFVAGNDDLPLHKKELSLRSFVHDLDAAPFIYKHLAFLGIEGVVDGMGFILKTEEEVREKLRCHRKELKRLKNERSHLFCVSHTPPARILDSAIRYSKDGLAHSIGSESLRRFITRNKVPATVCGHVHLFGGRSARLINENVVINIASHDYDNAPGNFAIIDISRSGRVEFEILDTYVFYRQSDLSRLTELGFSRFKKLEEQGIHCCADLTPDKLTKINLSGIGPNLFCKWLAQIELLKRKKPVMQIFAPEKFDFLNHPRLIVWDIETDLAQRCVWLIGAIDIQTGEKKQFFNPDDEQACLTEFAAWMKTKPEARTVSYSGSKMDARVVLRSAQDHGIEDSFKFLTEDVDLCPVLRYGTVNTYSSLRLKDLAAELGYCFKHPNMDGFEVGHMFTDYLISKESPNWQIYLDYNLDDVLATAHLIEHLQSIYNT